MASSSRVTVVREQGAPEVVETQREPNFRGSQQIQREFDLRGIQWAQRESHPFKGSVPSGL